VRLTDESVSETHAKLQRRDDGWYAVDMNSTNGTYVGGSRVTGDRRIDGAPDVRFGGVKLRFMPADSTSAEVDGTGTRTITAQDRKRAANTPASPVPEPITAPVTSGRGLLWGLIALAIIATVFFVLRGRA